AIPRSRPPTRIFSLLLGPPPSSTLFPYTTLFRSRRNAHPPIHTALLAWPPPSGRPRRASMETHHESNSDTRARCAGGGLHAAARSEEHTSELQSRENLVCRLLLEKKKDKTR